MTTDDKGKVLRDLGIQMAGCAELSEIAWALDYAHWSKETPTHIGSLISLKRLVAFYLKRSMEKPVYIQRGDWAGKLDNEMKDCELS